MNDKDAERGTPAIWDNAWREGHAHGLANGLGISYREAWQRTAAMLAGKPLDKTPGAGGATTRNADGEWVPSIPLPLYMWPHRNRCRCGRWFWTEAGYRGHYALAHIIKTPGGSA